MSVTRPFLAVLAASVTGAFALGAAPQSDAAEPASLLKNGDFAAGTSHWKAGTTSTRIGTAQTSRDGSAARVTAASGGRAILTDNPNVTGVSRGAALEASVWVFTDDPRAKISLSVKEKNGDGREIKHQVTGRSDSRWTQLRVPVTVTKPNAYLDFAVRADGLTVGDGIFVDDARLVPVGGGSTSTGAGQLTNGCSYSSRGIPACGAYVGGAYNSNENPKAWESWLTKHIGVRRTYFSASQVNSAVAVAKEDAAKKRVSWMSFKPPHSWKDMAQGRGDAWARDLATKMAKIEGPIWIAVHHEPENDGGDITQWTAMQARLAPIFRDAGSNVAYSIILMGWHELYGQSRYRLENIWPKNTTVDIAGFDVYDEYGMTKRGKVTTSHKEFRERYFEPFQAWSKKTGVRWGLAETGFTESSVRHSPSIMARTYNDLAATGGIALAYFNTHLNATMDWRLNSTIRKTAFEGAHRSAPTIR